MSSANRFCFHCVWFAVLRGLLLLTSADAGQPSSTRDGFVGGPFDAGKLGVPAAPDLTPPKPTIGESPREICMLSWRARTYVGTIRWIEESKCYAPDGCGTWDDETGKFVQYDGNWKQGRRHGTGIWRFSNGQTWKGEWKEDQPVGTGQLCDATGQVLRTAVTFSEVTDTSIPVLPSQPPSLPAILVPIGVTNAAQAGWPILLVREEPARSAKVTWSLDGREKMLRPRRENVLRNVGWGSPIAEVECGEAGKTVTRVWQADPTDILARRWPRTDRDTQNALEPLAELRPYLNREWSERVVMWTNELAALFELDVGLNWSRNGVFVEDPATGAKRLIENTVWRDRTQNVDQQLGDAAKRLWERLGDAGQPIRARAQQTIEGKLAQRGNEIAGIPRDGPLDAQAPFRERFLKTYASLIDADILEKKPASSTLSLALGKLDRP